jgi:hypothetical protein
MGLFIRPNYRPFAPLRQARISVHFAVAPLRVLTSTAILEWVSHITQVALRKLRNTTSPAGG